MKYDGTLSQRIWSGRRTELSQMIRGAMYMFLIRETRR
jgi:hypothetical protein